MKKYKDKDRRDPAPYKAKPYFDKEKHTTIIKVLPGECKVSAEPSETFVTTLGSCVAACIRDPYTGFGGMNHFMLPSKSKEASSKGSMDALRFGNNAMELLINEVLRRGCPREELEIKVFGGGNVIEGPNKIGSSNAKFVLEYLQNEGLRVQVADLEGSYPRKIHYSPSTGKVSRLIMRRHTDGHEVHKAEHKYQKGMKARMKVSHANSVEIFHE